SSAHAAGSSFVTAARCLDRASAASCSPPDASVLAPFRVHAAAAAFRSVLLCSRLAAVRERLAADWRRLDGAAVAFAIPPQSTGLPPSHSTGQCADPWRPQ